MRSTLLRFIPRMALAAAIALAVAACGGNGEASGAPAPQTDAPAPTANETVPGDIETAARKLLADELNADEADLELQSSDAMNWSDASLGCPEEGMAYAQVITPGFKLTFDRAGTSHAVHSNADGSHMVICEDGQ